MIRAALLRVACVLAVLAAPAASADEPLVISPDVMKSFERYKSRKTPMYFAVSADGLFSWYATCLDRSCGITQNYRRIAIEECEKAGGTDCLIFAVGDEIQVDYRIGDPATMTPARTELCDAAGGTISGAAADAIARLTPRACQNYRTYGRYGDFKALAGADMESPQGTWGWGYGHDTPEAAAKRAMAECANGRKEYDITAECRLFAIGDIVVDGMSDAELRRAMAVYRDNLDATNADLSPGP